jgi:two-component system, NarL family, nitrate/nitrite response regulator NarL
MNAQDIAKPIRVLAVDRSNVVLDAICSFLMTRGIVVVHVARNGLELLDQARVFQPDLVILNISTTNMEGPERVVRLRELLPKARIIAFTVYDLLTTRSLFLEAGADSVIQGEQLPERVVAEIQKFFPDK